MRTWARRSTADIELTGGLVHTLLTIQDYTEVGLSGDTHDEVSSDGELGLVEADPLGHHGGRHVAEELGDTLPAHGTLRDGQILLICRRTGHCWQGLTHGHWRGRRCVSCRLCAVVSTTRPIPSRYLHWRLLPQLDVVGWTIKCSVLTHPPVTSRVGGHGEGESGEREDGGECHVWWLAGDCPERRRDG